MVMTSRKSKNHNLYEFENFYIIGKNRDDAIATLLLSKKINSGYNPEYFKNHVIKSINNN